MNYSELKHVVTNLQDLAGLPFTGIWQPERERLIIGLGTNTMLLLVPRGPFSRIHTLQRRPKNPAKPFSFQGACRAYLRGRLQQLALSNTDREIFLTFEKSRLIIRMTGRSGGIWLEHEGKILASLLGPTPDTLRSLPDKNVLESTPRFQPNENENWDEAARRWYTTSERQRRRELREKAVRKNLERLQAKTIRLIENLSKDLEQADDAESVRRQADTLGIHLHKIKTGATHVQLPDPMNNDQLLSINLHPSKSPAQNMNHLYAKSRRLERMGERVLQNLERAENRLQTVDAALVALTDADDQTLLGLESRFVSAGSQRDRAAPKSKFWVTWTGPDKENILVGKSELGNRRLITQRGRGDDIWMHIRERPGPHVLIPMRKKQTPSLALLLAAGQIAVLHAKLADGETVDVQYAQLRHIRPIPGDHLGRVTVQREKVLQIRRDASVLAQWIRD